MNSALLRSPRILFCVLFLVVNFHAQAEDADSPDKLLAALRSDDFDQRSSAEAKLSGMGEAARSALEAGVKSPDLDVQQTSIRLLAKLDKAVVRILAFDRDGKPAVGAEADVQIYRADQWGNSEPVNQSITVTGEGPTRLTDQNPGQTNFNITWKKWSTGERSNYWPLLLKAGVNPLMVNLTSGGSVRATIQDGQGKPIKDAQLTLFAGTNLEPDFLDMQITWCETWQRNMFSSSSDATGNVTIDNVPDGVYECVARCSDYYAMLAKPVRVHEHEIIDIGKVTLAPKNNGKIKLVLLQKDGKPLKKTRVGVMNDFVFAGPKAAEQRRKFTQMKQQLEMRRQVDSPETADDGSLVLEDIVPGKYNLGIRSGTDTWQFRELIVTPGQTVEIKDLKPLNVGSITGKVLSGGKGVRHCNVTAAIQSDDGEDSNNNTNAAWRMSRGDYTVNTAQTQADGGYELKNLAPGKYTITINTRSGRAVMIYGLEVIEGKATAAPDAVIPEAVKQITASSGQTAATIKGSVVLPDGKPAASANVHISWKNNPVWGSRSTGLNCDDKGSFDYTFADDEFGPPDTLYIKVAGCKPYTLDLTTPNLKLKEIAIHLEKQGFGELQVKVIDENGNPISGATIRPGNRNRYGYYRAVNLEWHTRTNANGIGHVKGLAEGVRALNVIRDGYYLSEIPTVMISAAKPNEVTVKMHTGLVIGGHIEAPQGVSFNDVCVSLTGNPTLTSMVQADGTFKFTGLTPGEFHVDATGPGLTCSNRPQFTLHTGDKDPQLTLKLVRMAGAAISFGPEFSGYTVWAANADVDEASAWQHASSSAHSSIDSTGRAEIFGVAPGPYNLILYPPQSSYQKYLNTGGHGTVASTVVKGIDVKPLQTVAELRSITPVSLKVATWKGSIVGQISFDRFPAGMPTNYGTLWLKLAGKTSRASVAYSFPYEFQQRQNTEPIVIGTPPSGRTPVKPGSFRFDGVPPGEYKIIAEINSYRYNWSGSTNVEEVKPPPIELKTITLAENQQLDLGDVKFTVPPNVWKECMQQQTDPFGQEIEAEDQVPIFQP